MNGPCKHWLSLRDVCCECKSDLKFTTVVRREVRNPSFLHCRHSIVLHGFCIQCNDEVFYGLQFDYLMPRAKLSKEYVISMKTQKSGIGYGQRKFHLVLDLHRTLLDSCYIAKLADGEKHLVEKVGVRDDLGILSKRYAFSDVLVKLRPFVHQFLREADKLFVMYVYTNLNRRTSRRLVKMLDPLGIYFGRRVIFDEDSCGGNKTLGLVLAEERGVLIIDKAREAWDFKDRRNVIQIDPYRYFKHKCIGTPKILLNLLKNKVFKVNSDPKQKIPNNKSDDEDTALMDLLKSLKDLHRRFFNGPPYDVRVLLNP